MVGPTICTFDQVRLERARTVILIHRDGRYGPEVSLVKSEGSLTYSSCFLPISPSSLFHTLWDLGEPVEHPSYRILYIEVEDEN